MPVYLLGSERLRGCKYGFSATMDGVYECLNDARRFCIDYQILDIITEGTLRDESTIKAIGRKSGFHIGREQFEWVPEIIKIFKDYKMDLTRQGLLDFDICGCTVPRVIEAEIVAVHEVSEPLTETLPVPVSIIPASTPSSLPTILDMIPVLLPNGHKVRFSPKREHIQVFDAIASADYKNPHDVWYRIIKVFPELLEKCEKFRVGGRGQRFVYFADREAYLYLMAKLPGRRGQDTLETLIETTLRVWDNDVSLIEEMVDKIENPIDAKRVAIRAKTKESNILQHRAIAEHGGIVTKSFNIHQRVSANMNNGALGHTSRKIQHAGGKRSTRDNPNVTPPHLAALYLAETTFTYRLDLENAQGNSEILAISHKIAQSMRQFRQENGIQDVAI